MSFQSKILIKLFKSTFLFFVLPLQLIAQDITGLWTGFLQIDTTKLPYELVISKNENEFTGYAITIFIINEIENMGVKSIILKNKNGNIFVEDKELVYNNYTTPPKRVKQYNYLILKIEDSIMTMSGSFRTRSFESRPYSGTVHLQKKNSNSPSKLISKLDEIDLLNTLSFIQPIKKQKEVITAAVANNDQPKIVVPEKNEKVNVVAPIKVQVPSPTPIVKAKEKDSKVISQPATVKKGAVIAKEEKGKVTIVISSPNKKQENVTMPKPNITAPNPPVSIRKPEVVYNVGAAELAKRKIETIRTVSVKSDSLLLTLYDNGEIDGDTVSVLVNGKIILSKQGLTTNAIKKTIYFTPDLGDSLQVIMYAENLGNIPPNTGLLILQDGEDRYEIRFAGDLQKNSAIILKRKK